MIEDATKNTRALLFNTLEFFPFFLKKNRELASFLIHGTTGLGSKLAIAADLEKAHAGVGLCSHT